jgi:exocyst complex component 1
MHKARENVNGTFSIGKTWPLDDLSAVKSYSGVPATNAEEEQQKQWAGGIGFTVTLGKPYYWQANTAKEKQFFIASLVKIYTKYTGGKTPELIGFDSKERESLLGAAAGATLQSSSQQPGRPGAMYGQTSQNRPPPRREPSGERPLRSQPSRDAVQRPQAQMPPRSTPSLTSQTSRPEIRGSPSGSMDSNGGGPPPQSLRRLAGGNQSQESFGRSDDGASLPPRSRGGMNGLPSAAGRFQDRSITPNSLRTVTPDSTFSNPKDTADDVPPVPAPLTFPPERRRPPMPIIGDSRRGQNSTENIVPAPLSSPAMRREDLRPPTRSSERTQPREKDQKPKINDTNGISGETSDIVDLSIPLKSALSTTSPPIQKPEEPEEERPGLGPMIKSKKSRGDIAGQFMKAAKTANAFNSFKPRAGGAADRLRETQTKSSDGPDGITSVVPAPSLVRGMSAENSSLLTPPASISSDKMSPREKVSLRKSHDSIPEVKITVPQSDRPSSPEGPMPAEQDKVIPDKSQTREVKRIKSPAETMAKELASLGIDPAILGGRGGELVAAWEEFGWVGEGIRTKNIDQMKDEVERELNKIQAGGWLKMLDEEDERVEAIKQGLDKCIEECDELDGLLTLYSVELSVSLPTAVLKPSLIYQTLNEDIAYIEAQSQGLQVQAANQKLLQAELKSLLDTISISSNQLDSLREASLESPSGIDQIEKSLVLLFKAMLTIDPSLSLSGSRPSDDGGSLSSEKPGGFGNSEIGSMRVLQEKKDVYKNEAALFLRRLKPFLQVKFAAAIDETRKALEREKGNNLTRAAGRAKLDTRNHDLAREILWIYSPLMLFSREVDRVEWEELIKLYETLCKPLYQDEFRDAVFAWKRIARKPTGDENEMLFTSQIEKQSDGIATTARKLTVKRSQTLAKSLRSPIGDNSSKSSVDKTSDGRLQSYEVFTGALDEMIPIMTTEQNFIVEFFHISSLEQLDFPESVLAAPPDTRRGVDLRRPRVMEPNRDLAKLVVQSMEEVYTFFSGDMQALVDWAIQADPL